jgi:hypothetical protein
MVSMKRVAPLIEDYYRVGYYNSLKGSLLTSRNNLFG